MWYQTTRIYQRMIQMKPSTIKYPIRLTTLKYLTISTCSFILGYHYQQHWILQAQIQSQIKKKSNPYNFIADATEKVLDSVVNISVVNETSKLFSSKTIISSGSGFFIDKSGSILTNAHVVADVSTDTKVTVTTSDGVEYKAFVYSLDVLSDLAILKLHTTIPTKFNPVTFGSLEHIRPGDWVIAIGCPFGLQNTVTCGIVSSRNRKSNEIGGQDYRVRYLQTDCVVHSGSSGGPLVNLDGKVIGINTTRAESEGISFAIRIDSTFDMIQQLLRQGKVMRPYLGLQMISLSPNVWKQLTSKQTAHLPKIGQGVLVTKVLPQSPAEQAGLEEGDVITAYGDTQITSSQELLGHIGLSIGTPLTLTIKRNSPLEVDWDGRVLRYETVEMQIHVKAVELDVVLHQEINDVSVIGL